MQYEPTTPQQDGFSMPAEFSPHQGCILIWPERRIISVYAREILTGGGNIHCITQQIPEGAKL